MKSLAHLHSSEDNSNQSPSFTNTAELHCFDWLFVIDGTHETKKKTGSHKSGSPHYNTETTKCMLFSFLSVQIQNRIPHVKKKDGKQ